MQNAKLSRKLTEGGLMLAIATVLSLLKVFELPYGGSITFASMLPMVIYAYRYGWSWGILAGLAYGVTQMLFGLNNLSYATSAAAVIAIILLDYLFAFTSTAFGAGFRKTERHGLIWGALCACVVRYAFHVIAGCTVWAGLSIPTEEALVYSLAYNATYMIPETIVTVVAAAYLGSVLDFRKISLTPAKKPETTSGGYVLNVLSGLAALAAVVVLAALVFPSLQNAETGEFDITGLAGVNWTAALITVAAAAVVILGLSIAKTAGKKR